MAEKVILPHEGYEQTEAIATERKEQHLYKIQYDNQFKTKDFSWDRSLKISIVVVCIVTVLFLTNSLLNPQTDMNQSKKSEHQKIGESINQQQRKNRDSSQFRLIIDSVKYKQVFKTREQYRVQRAIIRGDKGYDFTESSEIITPGEEGLQLEIIENGGHGPTFAFPKILWMYLSNDLEKLSYINQLTINNNAKIAENNYYTLHFVNRSNYKDFLPNEEASRIQEVLQHLNPHLSRETRNLLIKQAIMISILSQNGGIFIEEYVSLLEDFDWLNDINSNIYINRGDKNIIAQMFAFHSPEQSSVLKREEKQQVLAVKKYMRTLPAIEHFFIAAEPGCSFIIDLQEQFLNNLKKSESVLKFLALELQKSSNIKKYESPWSNLFKMSSQLVLASMQASLNGTFAIDHYGIKTINKYYFPYKLESVFTRYQYQKTYAQLSRTTLKELESSTGTLRYVAVITPRDHIDRLLTKAYNNQEKYFVIIGSFLQKYLFPQALENFIIPNPQIPFKLEKFPKWSKLTKVIWLFWDNGLAQSHVTNQLAKRNMEEYAALSNFRVIEVNSTNLRQYIDKDEIQRIEQALYFTNRGTSFNQTFSDLVRLALLIKHGGVYMDASFVLFQSLDWLVNIASYPSQYIFNRYGTLPEVFMFFNPLYGSQFDEWKVDAKYNTKAHWHFSYENNFIACEPQSKLLIDWYENLLNYLTQPYSQTEIQFKNCGIYEHKWSNIENTYLLPMDAIKCVIGKREQELAKSSSAFSPASEYYKIWAISGYTGVQKFRGFTNFEQPPDEDNLFFRRYSQSYVSSVIGRPMKLIKLYSQNNEDLNRFLIAHLQGNISQQIHPRSFFNKYLLSFRREDDTFVVNGSNMVIRQSSR